MSSSRPARHRHRPGRQSVVGGGGVSHVSTFRRTASLAFAGAVIGITIGAPVEADAATLTVLKGHNVVTAVPGFAPGAEVQLRFDRVIDAGTSRADRSGTVHVSVPAPTTLGSHQLMLVGAISSTRPSIAAPSGERGDDPQTVVVFVPRLVTLALRVVPSLGVDAEQTDRGHDGSGHNGSGLGTAGESATADTGTNLWRPALIGAVLVVLGAAVTSLGRRRATSGQAT